MAVMAKATDNSVAVPMTVTQKCH